MTATVTQRLLNSGVSDTRNSPKGFAAMSYHRKVTISVIANLGIPDVTPTGRARSGRERGLEFGSALGERYASGEVR